MRLQDKSVIVTGAASGIGETIARVFAGEGARVAVTDINGTGVEATAASIVDTGGQAVALPGDLSSEQDVAGIVAGAVAAYGRVDALVHAAGVTITGDRDILDLPVEVWDRTIAVNLRGTFLICKAVVAEMAKVGGGSIVNISAASALRGGGGAAYSSSKGGVNTLTKVIAAQQSKRNIRANAICPGPIDSPMLAASMKKLGWTEYPLHPGTLPRVGRKEEVAMLAVFLASDESSFTTGAIYTVDGGQSQY
jgi:NAD(P)-dependent dehydrogenase (short-subunit alcohol dehydrogenase family)